MDVKEKSRHVPNLQQCAASPKLMPGWTRSNQSLFQTRTNQWEENAYRPRPETCSGAHMAGHKDGSCRWRHEMTHDLGGCSGCTARRGLSGVNDGINELSLAVLVVRERSVRSYLLDRRPSGERGGESNMGRYVNQSLMQNEHVEYQTHLHWVIYVRGVLLLLLGIIVFFASPYGVLGSLLMLIALVVLARDWIKWITSEFAVTSKRVIIKTGWISRDTMELNLSKVESVDVDQNVIQRLLGYGTVKVIGIGGSREPFKYIDNPLNFRRAVQTECDRESHSEAHLPPPVPPNGIARMPDELDAQIEQAKRKGQFS